MDATELAQLAYENYYLGENLNDYLDEAIGRMLDELEDTIAEDVHDLLHNGNAEDLFGDRDDLDELVELLDDNDYFDTFCAQITTLMKAEASTLSHTDNQD